MTVSFFFILKFFLSLFAFSELPPISSSLNYKNVLFQLGIGCPNVSATAVDPNLTISISISFCLQKLKKPFLVLNFYFLTQLLQ